MTRVASGGPQPIGLPAAILGDLVADHRAQPIAKAAPGRIVLVDVAMLKDREHHVLNDFLGRVFRAAAMAGKAVDRRPVVPEELVPGQGVGPVAKPLQECRPRAGRHAGHSNKKTGDSSILRG